MTFAKLVRSLLVIQALMLLPAQPAKAAPRLQIQEVDLVGYRGAALRVRVELACGSELYGLIVRAAAGNRLEIAAAVMSDAVACTSMPEPIELLADFLSTAGYNAVAAMEVDERNPRFAIAQTSDVKLLPPPMRGGARAVEAIYQTRCGASIGTLIRRTSPERLEIGVAERVSNSRISEACPGQQVRQRLVAFNPASHLEVSPLAEKPANLSRAFVLKYAAIQAGSFKREASNAGIELTYARSCNDAPVGVVVDDKGLGADGRRRVEVGMIVARYYNFPCPGGPRTIWDRFADADLRLGGNNLLIELKSAPGAGELAASLAVKTPTMVSVSVGNSRKLPGLTVSYLRPCAESGSLLYSRDRDDQLAVGVLVASTSACKSPGIEVSLHQPFLAERVRTTGIMPLRLKGQYAR